MNTYFKSITAATFAFGLFFIAGNAEAAPNITSQAAQEIATTHANVPLAEANFSQVSFDEDFLHAEYEIEFFHNNVEYDYEIDANSGEIKSYTHEWRDNARHESNTQGNNYITEEEAKEAAFSHANVSSPSFVRVEFDMDDGVAMYDIEFSANNSRYEYEVNAISGEIIKLERE